MSRRPETGDDERGSAPTAAVRQRIDKWLWFARVVKSRSLAAQLVAGGHVRINGTRVEAPAKAVVASDVLTIALERQVRVLRVISGGSRRGPYEEARLLYEDLTPTEAKPEAVPDREPGSGRPSKKDRREREKRFRDF